MTLLHSDRAPEERPRRTTAVQILLHLALMILCPAILLLAAAFLPYRSPLAPAVGCLLSLALLVAALRLGWSWLHARRASRGRDVLPVLCVLLGSAAMLGFSQLLADSYGIQGSALPRMLYGVRHGISLALDLSYLAFAALSLLALVGALLALPGLLLRSGPVRSLLGREPDRGGEPGEGAAGSNR